MANHTAQQYPPAYGSLTIQVPFSVHGACFLLKDDATESTKYAGSSVTRSKELFYLFNQTFGEKSLGGNGVGVEAVLQILPG